MVSSARQERREARAWTHLSRVRCRHNLQGKDALSLRARFHSLACHGASGASNELGARNGRDLRIDSEHGAVSFGRIERPAGIPSRVAESCGCALRCCIVVSGIFVGCIELSGRCTDWRAACAEPHQAVRGFMVEPQHARNSTLAVRLFGLLFAF